MSTYPQVSTTMIQLVQVVDQLVHSLFIQHLIPFATISAHCHGLDELSILLSVFLQAVESCLTASKPNLFFLLLDQMVQVLERSIVVRRDAYALQVDAEHRGCVVDLLLLRSKLCDENSFRFDTELLRSDDFVVVLQGFFDRRVFLFVKDT